MGVSRHQYVLVLVALADEFVEEHFHFVYYLLQFVTGEEFQVDEHLVVARPSAMYLLAHVAQPLCEHQLHL